MTADGTAEAPWSVLSACWSPDGSRAVVQKMDYRGLFCFAASYYMEQPQKFHGLIEKWRKQL